MIESVVGISMAMTALLSTLTLFTQTLHYSALTDKKLVGTHLAAEGVELVKNMIDADYAQGSKMGSGFGVADVNTFQVSYDKNTILTDKAGTPLLFSEGAYTYTAGTPSGFMRDITTTRFRDKNANVYEVSVSSTVKYAGMDDIVVEDRFYNWRQ